MTHDRKARVLMIGTLKESLITARFALLKDIVSNGYQAIACAAERDKLSDPSCSNVRATLDEAGITYHPYTLDRTGTNPIADVSTFFQLYNLCRRYSPDVVVTYNIKPVIYGSLAARLAGVPNIYSMITGIWFGVADNQRSTIMGRVVRFLGRSAISYNKALIFQNPDDREALIKSGLCSPSHEYGIVNGSGVDIAAFTTEPFINDTPTFLLIARLIKPKGIYEYAEAARRVKKSYPNARFVLIGPLDEHPEAVKEEEIRTWEKDGILEWKGAVSDVRPFIAESTVFVLPSYHEGTPRTVLEAMAMGRPVITTDAPGCRETVTDGLNGLLVDVGSVDMLVDAMVKFLENPALVKEMGDKGRMLAEDKYDVRKVNAHVLKIMGLK